MAKRRKLEAPSAEELSKLEAEYTGSPLGRAAPIAQIAADAAGAHDPRPMELREASARDKVDAAALREAKGRGLVMLELPTAEIDADALVRDRVVMDPAEMEELRASIAANGLRLPVEVFPRDGEGPAWGLLSGYRRLRAIRDLHAQTGDDRFATVKAVVRDPSAMGGTFAAMIEENEIRAALSPFERGRIAVIAAQQGAFAGTDAAVAALFPAASKAKRSKIRSFALIFEELGDMLTFPDQLKEKDGLRLATALRGGAEAKLRDALAERVPDSAADEAELINAAIAELDPASAPSKGGRPKKPAPKRKAKAVRTRAGITLQAVEDGQGWAIRLAGADMDEARIEALLERVGAFLDEDEA
ncbi:chromosome partitioning protein ParB [Salipiger pallidus]|uniref:Chromosome partitioning protein ParB n=1 Tax=Salipiger pallidus TaxID=1775170 RepID=A0A8J3EHM2_9RHOB|nr:ParB N-terminal domain-containing protein [Salipiger pallidus]GGG84173.1 chromosome partitioning protein ParB [Salipiger pallidus]